jgi:5-methylcytosine-specific restriction endonuclease McrA
MGDETFEIAKEAELKFMPLKRKSINKKTRKLVFDKTGGRCHMCGKVLFFNAAPLSRGRWHVDHILQKSRNGEDSLRNYLPVCRDCNFLRRNYASKTMRRIFKFGIIARGLSKKKTDIGSRLSDIYEKTRKKNIKNRKSVSRSK